ncbi:8-amino-7-oxononanoate synthase [Roseimaritima multifibrata]|uniref:8-amino-7-oxononanoate synthase n=1 Tax=Roseimaritima multifibrata TaxID=1930274 RepID=A0A517MP98_9BACT|nr:8-amino-7-oxononanoate synthase [Roseimaritima multifibrata]QDS96702.1 8-amino-7-oxononanoate synthase [Roseimaritima multifibrata]
MSNRIGPPKFAWMDKRLQQWDDVQLKRQLRPVQADGMTVIGEDGKPRINFGSNDYLGLAAENYSDSVATSASTDADMPDEASSGEDHSVDSSIRTTLRKGSGSSQLVCGYTEQHARFAAELAAWEQTEAVALYSSGYAACSGVVSALARRGDLILSDAFNHASLIDGCRLSKAERFVYPHCDVAAVAALLQHHRKRFQNVWIITDSVFSMDGDIAPLSDLVDLAIRFDATMIVDEAHATGVLGNDGSGACKALGVKEMVDIRIGTLSKAFGVQGGFVAGPQVVIDYLLNTSRPLIYSTSPSPLTIQIAAQHLHEIQTNAARRYRLAEVSRRLRSKLQAANLLSTLFTALESRIPIHPIRIGSAEKTIAIANQLWDRGFYVPAIRPPTVPEGTSRLRISLSAAHTDSQIDALADELQSLLG